VVTADRTRIPQYRKISKPFLACPIFGCSKNVDGSSVVDYCLVPIEQWHVFEHFSVLPPLEVSHRFQISVDCSLPDHSILLWSIRLDCPHINTPKPTNPNPRQKFKIPLIYMQSELTSSKIQNIIDKINPQSIQKAYKDTCSLIFSELIPYKNSQPNKCCHPWWNPSLNLLRQNLHQSQKAWLKQNGNAHLKLAYQSLQKTFDKAVKKAESIGKANKFNLSTKLSIIPKNSGEVLNN